MNDALGELRSALADLGATRRHHLIVAATESRDAAVERGDRAMGRVFQAWAVVVAEVADAERDTLRALDPDRHGLSAEIVADDTGEEA
jgi:hypothetical protein